MEHFIVFCIFYSKADRSSSQSNKKGSWILKRAFIASCYLFCCDICNEAFFFSVSIIIVSHFNWDLSKCYKVFILEQVKSSVLWYGLFNIKKFAQPVIVSSPWFLLRFENCAVK